MAFVTNICFMWRGDWRGMILRTVVLLSFILTLAASESTTIKRQKPKLREVEKNWWLRDISFSNGMVLRISPATILILTVSAIYIFLSLSQKSSVEASHILMEGKDAKEKLEKYKKEIDNDPVKFGKYAEKYSICPSGKAGGGNLGTFKPGSMVPAFDKAVFSPESPIHTTLGPIETNFGYHLIYIHSRTIKN